MDFVQFLDIFWMTFDLAVFCLWLLVTSAELLLL